MTREAGHLVVPRDASVPAANPARAMRRRRRYQPRLWRQDYFVLSHITSWLNDRIVAEIHSGMSVADIGCGEQPLRALIEARGARYTGIDIVQNTMGSVDVLAPITSIPCSDAAFDLILCTEVLEHVSHTRDALAEIARLLVPGGRAILTTPFCYPLHEEPHDYVRITPYQLRSMAAETELVVEDLVTTGDELEVTAMVIDNLWSRLRPGRRGILLRGATVGIRLLVNTATIVASMLIGRHLPRRCFLSTLCIVRRPGGVP